MGRKEITNWKSRGRVKEKLQDVIPKDDLVYQYSRGS